MLRPSPLPHVLAVLATGVALVLVTALAVAGVVTVAPPARADAVAPLDPQQPLVPRIRSISPDYVPEKGPVVVRGTVTNASDQTWTAINVHGFMGSTALTTQAELAQAAGTAVVADVGHRITVPGTFDSIASLAPGETARFEIRLPRSTLPVSSPGVYWFGVHVLGDNGEGAARVAVGRDRTFLTYLPAGSTPAGQHEDTALVVPVRAGVERGPDGAVIDPEQWTRDLRSGPLHEAVTIGRAAGDHQLTWLVDPAVPDVVRRLAHGNPARTLASPHHPQGPGGPSASPSASASSSPTTSDTGSGASATGAADTTAAAASVRAAKDWLAALRPLLRTDTSQVMGLPYGDLALDTAAQYDQPLLQAAYERTGHALRPWNVPLSQAAAPPDGRTTGETISALPHDTQVLLDDTAVEGSAPVVDRVHGRRVVLMSTAAAEGGPGPVDPLSSLALRQRILAEAAVRLIAGGQPLVVELPTDVRHSLKPRFFTGLDVPWLRLTTLGGATAQTPTVLDDTRLRQPSPDAPRLGPHLYDAAQDALSGAGILRSVLVGRSALRKRLFEEVAGDASYAASQEPLIAFYRMRATAAWVRSKLAGINLAAPPSVTLASTSGRFSALVSNDLDVPVTVRVRAFSDAGLQITGGETVQLPPHGRSTVLLNASTHRGGVHSVTLELTNAQGRSWGARDSFPMRAEQVSGLIWVIIGAGIALLFAAIVVRLVRRVVRERARRRTAAMGAS